MYTVTSSEVCNLRVRALELAEERASSHAANGVTILAEDVVRMAKKYEAYLLGEEQDRPD